MASKPEARGSADHDERSREGPEAPSALDVPADSAEPDAERGAEREAAPAQGAEAAPRTSGEPSTSGGRGGSSAPGGSLAQAQAVAYKGRRKPIVVIVVGMAGSGKTTLMQRLCAHVSEHRIRSYVINLDPAVLSVPYPANIDIRDTVNYKNVMKEYRLGPNGGIVTSLNLFATKIHEVLELVERRADALDMVLLDTPGQIEIFTWSASGAIITEAFATVFPTVVAYVVDTPRSCAPPTFMSNMLYACGILYKTRLPLLLVFNKVDVVRHEFALEWMKNYEAFQAALDEHDAAAPFSTYSSSLYRSLCLVLDEFYRALSAVGVSAVTGAGVPAFFKAVEAAGEEFAGTYGLELQKKLEAKEEQERRRQEVQAERFERDHRADVEAAKLQGLYLDKGAHNSKVTSQAIEGMEEDGQETDDEDDSEQEGDEDDEVA